MNSSPSRVIRNKQFIHTLSATLSLFLVSHDSVSPAHPWEGTLGAWSAPWGLILAGNEDTDANDVLTLK
ncbi:hypothetical protein Nepgr_012811 [Nepenthes gracilis]|uniref:Uncharacterized protein n=1 Tax=Nepenthes gracilis TaxID=150966 RepID=A0AAD3SGF2_NEPGR|nr:hypothetical protein Nepgr_012811 [Nepenthes gracilis]